MQNPSVPEARKKQEVESVVKKEAKFLRFIRTKETPANFQTIKVIGKGAFGEVKLVQRKTDGKIYALKSLIKTEMFKRDQLAHVRAERDILADSKDNPWLVKLHASFQDKAYLYLLMEFLPGGDLMTMLIKYEIFSEDITRFYMAELVMAIEAVHKLGFLHRYVFTEIFTSHLVLLKSIGLCQHYKACVRRIVSLNPLTTFIVISSQIMYFWTVVGTSSSLILASLLEERSSMITRTIRRF